MKKLNKVAMLLASAVLATSAGAQVKAADGGKTIDNWQNGTGELVWKNGTNELCWRDANWTPATAAEGCDGALTQAAAATPAAPAATPAAPAPAAKPAVAASKVTYAADAFFDFDKAVLKPEGKAKLDDLVGKIQGINLEVIIAVGHTDSVGTDAYNQKLSERRAAAVRDVLVKQYGVSASRVSSVGYGESRPVADNATEAGRAVNRRVEAAVEAQAE